MPMVTEGIPIIPGRNQVLLLVALGWKPTKIVLEPEFLTEDPSMLKSVNKRNGQQQPELRAMVVTE